MLDPTIMRERIAHQLPVDTERAGALLDRFTRLLASQLAPADRGVIVPALPAQLHDAIQQPLDDPPSDPDDVARAFAEVPVQGLHPAEVVEVVGEVFVQVLDDEGWKLLRRRLPDVWFSWLGELHNRSERAPSSKHPDPVPVGPDRGLAGGKPGSRRPISEANPSQPHSESVAASDNPHGDRKLSSSTGRVSQTEDLATGQPKTRHPAGDVHEES